MPRFSSVSSTEQVAAFKEIDNCANVASVRVVATGDSSTTYSVKPIAAGSCTAHVIDDDGNTVSVPIVVRQRFCRLARTRRRISALTRVITD